MLHKHTEMLFFLMFKKFYSDGMRKYPSMQAGASLQPGTYAPAFYIGGGVLPGSATEGHAP
jgi:hypothetical protein